jgi:hypothetical protein
MSIDATRSEGNADKMYGYLEGYASGQKCGSEIMKMKACREFSKILTEICPELLGYGAMAAKWENEFRKRLEE